jgi:hypothetical protein
MPRPWRVKALRSDGQVVPSSAAAALTLPSCSARWKARSASARSVRKRLGCQPTRCWACKAPLVAVGEGSTSIRPWFDRLQPVAETLRPLSGVLVPIDNRDRVESVSHLPRHTLGARL